jgi:hypothetical protein
VLPPQAAARPPATPRPHLPPPPDVPTAPETNEQPSSDTETPSSLPQLDTSQVVLLDEDLEAEVQTLDSPVSSRSASEVSSLPSPTESQFSQVSFEASQEEHLVEGETDDEEREQVEEDQEVEERDEEEDEEDGDDDEDEVEDEGSYDDVLDATHQNANIQATEAHIANLDGGVGVAEGQDSRLVPLPSESVEKEAPSIQPSVPLSKDTGGHGLESLEESEEDLEREVLGSASLVWGLALGGLAAVAFIAMKPNLGRAFKDVARKVTGIRPP